jgi:predicted secreted protein
LLTYVSNAIYTGAYNSPLGRGNTKSLKITFFGNYCGPYWSDGQFQTSVVGSKPALSELDQLCKEHDKSYALNEDLDLADDRFIEEAWKINLTGKLFSSMVKANKTFRGPAPSTNRVNQSRNTRPVAPSKNTKILAPTALKPSVSMIMAPNSFGSQIQSVPSTTRQTKDGLIVRSRDLVITVKAPVLTTGIELCGAIPLNPTYFVNGSFSEYTPFYEQFRLRRIRFTYITSSPTSSGGEVFMYLDENPSVSVLNSRSTSFPSKLMSTKNSVMGPLWLNTSLDYRPGSQDYKLLNPITNASMEESTYGTFYIFQSNPASTAGYVIADCEIEFVGKRNTMYQSPLSYITPYTYTSFDLQYDYSATPVQGTDVLVTTYSLSPNPSTPGTIYKLILDMTNSVMGSTIANAWQLSYYNQTASPISLTSGTVVYALVQSAAYTKYYWSFAAAQAGFLTTGTNQTNAIQYGSGGLRSKYAVWQVLVYAPGSQSLGA